MRKRIKCRIKLKPCPFCGSKWVQVRWIGFTNGPPCAFDSGYRGECTDCGVTTVAYRTPEEAEDAWQRRKHDTAI